MPKMTNTAETNSYIAKNKTNAGKGVNEHTK